MYCSSCGVAVTKGLSYCNHCGAKVNRDDGVRDSPEVRPEMLVAAMVGTFVFGLVAITATFYELWDCRNDSEAPCNEAPGLLNYLSQPKFASDGSRIEVLSTLVGLLGAWMALAVAALLLLVAPAGRAWAANFVLVNLDGPGEGFNDPTPVAPVEKKS